MKKLRQYWQGYEPWNRLLAGIFGLPILLSWYHGLPVSSAIQLWLPFGAIELWRSFFLLMDMVADLASKQQPDQQQRWTQDDDATQHHEHR